MNTSIIQKALSVAVDGASIADYLPKPLAAEIIEFVRDLNIVRRLVPTFTMPARNWSKPKRQSGTTAYFIPDGITATLSSYSATKITWIAKKLMSFVLVDEEAIEDSQPDVVQQVLDDFAMAIAEAEEIAFLQGDPTATATAPTPDSATTTNFFVRDARLAFRGIFIAADDALAAAPVAAGAAAFDVDFVNQALFNLGKFGRNKSDLLGWVPPVQAANMRGNTDMKDASKTGLALASFISGLGSAGEGNGIITNIYGVTMYEAPQAPDSEIVIQWRRAAEIGDRRLIRFRSEDVIETEQRKFVVSERIAFEFNYVEALVKIDNLSTTVV